MRLLAAMLLAAACGGRNAAIDAAVDDDAPVLDTPLLDAPLLDAPLFDAPTDGPELDAPVDGLVTYRFVVSALRVPATNIQALMYGLDLTNDTFVDNQMGIVTATLASVGLPRQPAVTRAIDHGEILMLPELRTDSLAQSVLPVTFALFEGKHPTPAPCLNANDTVCRRHLTGMASFQIAADSAPHAPLVGIITNGELVAGPGQVRLIVNLFGGSMPLELDLIGARVKLKMISATGIGTGSISGGIPMTEVNTKVFPGLQASAMEAVTKDCTGIGADCGCIGGTDGQAWLTLLDSSPQNCVISLEEAKTDPLLQALIAQDVTLEGKPAISIGLQVEATRAVFLQ